MCVPPPAPRSRAECRSRWTGAPRSCATEPGGRSARTAVPVRMSAVRAWRSVNRVKKPRSDPTKVTRRTPTVYSLYHSAGTRAQSHAQGELCVCPLAWPFTLATAAVPRAESRPLVSTRSRVPCRQVHRLRVADRAACRPFPATDHHHSSIIISTAAAAAAAAATAATTARSPQRPRCAVVVVVVS